jgi:hypothetical protein
MAEITFCDNGTIIIYFDLDSYSNISYPVIQLTRSAIVKIRTIKLRRRIHTPPSRIIAILVMMCGLTLCVGTGYSLEWYVSTVGSDDNPGTMESPFATLDRARREVREHTETAHDPLIVFVRGGTHYLSEPVAFSPEDGGTPEAPILYTAYAGESPVISGGRKLDLVWRPYKNGIMQAEVPGSGDGALTFTRMFVNGKLCTLARYPNADSANPVMDGTAADAIDPDRIRHWADPVGGYVHGLHHGRWGSLHYRITGINDSGELALEGGYQVNRDSRLHEDYRYVENIFEELDAPGEWYLNTVTGILYLYPPSDVDMTKAHIEVAVLKQLIVARGSEIRPVQNLTFHGLTFAHTDRICLDPYEPLLRGDWSINRTGAVFLEGTENISIEGCRFDAVGGSAIFMNHYNRRNRVANCTVEEAGENGVCLVGDLGAVRTPSTWESHLSEMLDIRGGPLTSNYPQDCIVTNNYMRRIGRIGKQTAGVFISMAERITVSHNTIHDIPRAAICINDGTWGGHIIEFNDLYDTVRETGDHGPFNSWGRDRFWSLVEYDTRGKFGLEKQPYALLDARSVTHIRYNRMYHEGGHTWGIDLDDGSSNYHVYKNLCLGMGIKFREGFFRRMENNIIVNGFGGFHVWYEGCEDVVARNIIVSDEPYQFIMADPSQARQMDYNLFYNYGRMPNITGVGDDMTLLQWQERGFDTHSIIADPLFVDAANGDYSVRPGSPALELGFENFPMDRFGVISGDHSPGTIVIHRNVDPPEFDDDSGRDVLIEIGHFLGARVTNIHSEGIQSSTGMGSMKGVYLAEVPDASTAAEAGFIRHDVIMAIDGASVDGIAELGWVIASKAVDADVSVQIFRNQQETVIRFNLSEE